MLTALVQSRSLAIRSFDPPILQLDLNVMNVMNVHECLESGRCQYISVGGG